MPDAGFYGVFPYLVSPVDSAGEVKADVLARLCEDLIKGALELQGYPVGNPLPPQAPLPPEGVEEVKRALVAVGAL